MNNITDFLISDTYWIVSGVFYGIGLIVTVVAIIKRKKKKKGNKDLEDMI